MKNKNYSYYKTKIFVICLCLISFLQIFFFSEINAYQPSKDYKNSDPIIKFFGMGKSEMTTIAPTNALGREINQLYALLTWVGIGIMAIVFFLFFIIIYRFREKKNLKFKEDNWTSSKNTKTKLLELFWTVVPVIILIVITIPTVKLIFKIENFPSFKDKEQIVYRFDNEADQIYDRYLKVNVIGHQWWWEFEYLSFHTIKDGKEDVVKLNKTAANEARFPVGVPVLFQVNSEDVIHSFWAPRLAGKIDANPGVSTYISFVFEEEGYYWGQCAEYCGASHALMRFNLVGVSQTKFQKWLDWGKGEAITTTASAQRGKELMKSCLACHTMSGLNDFQPREKRYKEALANFNELNREYQKELKKWAEAPREEGEGHFDKYARKTIAPKMPVLYKDYMRTIAPDLTDLGLRKRFISGIKENKPKYLVEWIKNPPLVKPEIRNTKVTRMPVYEKIYTEEQIKDIVEFLLTVEYSESVNSNSLKLK